MKNWTLEFSIIRGHNNLNSVFIFVSGEENNSSCRSVRQYDLFFSGQVQTPYFTWAESNANEGEQRIFLICIRFGSCEVRHLNRALQTVKILISHYLTTTRTLIGEKIYYSDLIV